MKVLLDMLEPYEHAALISDFPWRDVSDPAEFPQLVTDSIAAYPDLVNALVWRMCIRELVPQPATIHFRPGTMFDETRPPTVGLTRKIRLLRLIQFYITNTGGRRLYCLEVLHLFGNIWTIRTSGDRPCDSACLVSLDCTYN